MHPFLTQTNQNPLWMPQEIWHSASVGLDLWLTLLVGGARQIMVLCTEDDAPAYVQALGEQAELTRQLLQGLGL